MKMREGFTLIELLLVVMMLGIVLSVGRGCLVREEPAVKAMQDAGFTDVAVTDSHRILPTFFGCGRDDAAGFEMRAKNSNGTTVHTVVCCGFIFKSCTIRY